MGIFLLLTIIFFFPIIMGKAFLWEDFIEQTYPIQSYAARHLAQGELPFWNPFSFNGMPFLADVQVGFFYPPNMLLALFVQNGAVSVMALQLLILAHVVVAQIGMALLLRSWNITSVASLVGGIVYGFSGMMVCHLFHPMMVYHCAWLPFILLHFVRSIEEKSARTAWKHTLFAGLLFGITMLSGHPQTTLYIALLLGIVMAYMVTERFLKSADEPMGKRVLTASHQKIRSLAVIAIAGGIFAIQLLPSQELATLSERSTMTYEKAVDGSLAFGQIFTSVVPKLFGSSSSTQNNPAPWYLQDTPYYYYWETSFYAGSATMVLMCIAFAVRGHRSRVWMMSGAMVFGFLYALGKHGFLFEWMFALPYFNQFRIPARMMLYVYCGVPIVGAIALDALLRHARSNKQEVSLRNVVLAGSIPVVIALMVASGVLPSFYDVPPATLPAVQSSGTSALIFALAMLGVVVLFVKRLFPAGILALSAGVIVFAQLYVEGGSFNLGDRSPTQAYALPPALSKALSIVPPDTLFRVKTRERGMTTMQRNQGMISPIMMFEGYNQLLLQRRMPPAMNADATHDMLSIRYEIKQDAERGAYFAERPTALPFARMVYQVHVAPIAEIPSLMQQSNFDYRSTAIVEEPLPLTVSTTAETTSAVVRCTLYSPNTQTYTVMTPASGLLVVSDIWYPAFEVELDGQPARLYRVNTCFRGVAIPAGEHSVTLRFRSPAFALGSTITLSVLGCVVVGLIVLQIGDWRERNQSSSSESEA